MPADEQSMVQVHDLGESYDEVLAKFRASLDDTRRHWAAYMLAQYPDRAVLQVVADAARAAVHAKEVQINAVYKGRQVTVASAPAKPRRVIREEDSLCALTAGTGWPLAIDDIAHDPITVHHAARQLWGSWASVPLNIQGYVAGTICVLEEGERSWTQREQKALAVLADQVSAEVEDWIASERSN